MGRKLTSYAGLILLSACLFMVEAARPVAAAPLTIDMLQTNKGCGESATFVPGEIVRVFLRVTQTAAVSMTVQKTGQTAQPVFTNVTVQGGVLYFIDLTAGSDGGQRVLDLTASAGGTNVEQMCDY